MKNRKSSHCLRSATQVRDVLRENLRPTESEKAKRKSDSWQRFIPSVTYLISSHLSLDPTWPSLELWLDYVEFSSINVERPDTVKVTGAIWCGYSSNIGGAQWPEAIEGEFALSGPEPEPCLSYSIKHWSDEICRLITPAGVTRISDGDTTGNRDLKELIDALKSRNSAAPEMSGIIHLGLASLIHNITSVTAYTLACAGKQGIAALIEVIKGPDREVREAAIYALGLVGTEAREAVPVILNAFGDEDQQLRSIAAVALCRVAGEEKEFFPILRDVVPDLVQALKEQSYRERNLYRDVSRMAEKALTFIATEDHRIIPALIAALKDKDARRKAARVLHNIGAPASAAIPTLVEAFKSCERDWSNVAAFTLWRLGPKGAQSLIEALKHENIRVRDNAVMVIKEYSGEANLAVPALIEALKHNSSHQLLRCEIAYTLAKIDIENEDVLDTLKSVIPDLIHDLKGNNQFATRYAARTLGLLGSRAAVAIPELIELLKERREDKYVCGHVIEALGEIGASASGAIPALSEIARRGDELFLSAVKTLSKLGPEGVEVAISLLIKVLNFPDLHASASYEFCQVLETVGEPAVPALAELVSQKAHGLCFDALMTLGNIGSSQALPAITRALEDDDPCVRSAAARSLIDIGGEARSAISALRKALSDPDLDVCAGAAKALAGIGPESIPVLIAALKDGDPFTVKWATTALGKIGAEARQSISSLREALNHEDLEVREMAAIALQKIAEEAAGE
ncbi:MAG: HEAT repeat domain-containing protein [Blastocatellia bacterium]